MFMNKQKIKLTAPVLAVLGSLGMSLPSAAVTASYNNDYRVCAARLLSVGVAAETASQACATALRPRDLSACVIRIEERTQIPASDAVATCREVRRPENLATCVVGISQNSQEAVNPVVLDYCRRSLLPERFAECVVGLRAEIDFAPTQAMEACIDASDRVSGFLPSFILGPTPPFELRRNLDTTPIPVNPGN
jgi:hypothetical protein